MDEMEAKTLKQLIMNEIDNRPRGFAEILAKIAGSYSNGGNLKRVLSDPKKEFDNFNGLLRIIEHIWKNDSVKMMVKYSNEVDPNKKTARNLLEYLATNREFEAFNNLINRMDSCKNNESLEWAKVYKMQYKYEVASSPDDYHEILKEISDIHVTIEELKVYKKLILSYCFNQLDNFVMFKLISEEIKREIDSIENEYIKESYTIRTCEVLAYYYLRICNDVEAARECADRLISSNARDAFKAYAYYIKGYSYLFTSYDKAIEYLNKSKEIYITLNREHDIKTLTDKIEFVKVYWNKLKDNKCFHLNNKILNDIKNGSNMTNSLNESIGVIDVEFHLYLDGLNSNDNKKLMLSLIKYTKKNDLFSANLPKLELLKNGYDEDILNELTK